MSGFGGAIVACVCCEVKKMYLTTCSRLFPSNLSTVAIDKYARIHSVSKRGNANPRNQLFKNHWILIVPVSNPRTIHLRRKTLPATNGNRLERASLLGELKNSLHNNVRNFDMRCGLIVEILYIQIDFLSVQWLKSRFNAREVLSMGQGFSKFQQSTRFSFCVMS